MKKNELKQNKKRQNSQSVVEKLPSINKKQTISEKASLLQISYQDQGIVSLLYEYFLKNNFLDTLDSFQKDCHDKGFKPNNRFIQSLQAEIIEAFQTGNRDTFFIRFGQFIPLSMRNKAINIMKLQFSLQVYFFIFAIHPQLGKKKTIDAAAKQSFIAYLQGRGAALAKSSEFLQFYALAFLQKPQDHQTFKNYFTKDWIDQIKKQLVYLLQKMYTPNKLPSIIQIYDKYVEKNLQKNNSEHSMTQPDEELQIQQQIEPQQSEILNQGNQANSRAQQSVPQVPHYQSLRSPNAFETTDRQKQSMSLKIAELESQKSEMMKYLQNEKKKYQSLQYKYKDFTDAAQNTLMQSQSKWFKITQQFYNMASSLKDVCVKIQSGQTLEDPSLVQKIGKKLSKYESFVKMNIQDLISQNVDFSLFERPEHDMSVDMVRRNMDDRSQFLIQLDFDKIKATLSNNSPDIQNQKCTLLQALKTRIIKTRGALFKRQVILSFTINDILDLKEGDEMVKLLLNHNNPVILMKIMQYLNAFTKDLYGRNYLSTQKVINNALNLLKNDNIQQNTLIITVSFLQQLSVRKNAQHLMIEGNIIQWIIEKLKNQRDTMPEQLMQYSLATIINLLLKKKGLEKALLIKQDILKTLIDLMEFQMSEIRQYVHGAIYSLFLKKVFREKAKQYGLEENIKFLLKNTESEYLINQLNHLQKQLMREDEQSQQQNEEDQDMDQIIDEEFGEDFDFELQVDNVQGLSGEEFLMKKYSLTGPDSIRQLNMIRQEAQATLKNKSVYVASNFSQRPSTNNPRAPMRKNISNNNSVYSNKSSSRILKSEMMNRSQLNKNQGKQRLDTVRPDNSEKEMSIKDFMDDQNFKDFPNQNNSKKNEENQFHSPNNQVLDNDSFNNISKQQGQHSRPHRPLKPYEKSQQYQKGFVTRSKLVRTPPQK